MRIHSRVGLVTNSSSETFSFSGLGRSQEDVNQIVIALWLEFCSDPANEEALREWYNGPVRPGMYDPPVTFRALNNGAFEHYTSMDNDEVPEQFAQFVVDHMNRIPTYQPGGIMRDICRECISCGMASCPPCRL